MRKIVVGLASVIASGCLAGSGQPQSNGEVVFARFATLPPDARDVAERASLCAHFAGEIAGDRSARDREVHGRMTDLDCDKIERELAVLRRKYAANPAVYGVLAELGGW